MRVLIAEDNLVFQKMFREFVESRYPGSEVTVVSNGNAAERALHESTFDLLLTDLNMSGGNGENLIFKIRHGEISKERAVTEIPIILITAPPGDAALPVNGAMGETIDFEALVELINRAVKAK